MRSLTSAAVRMVAGVLALAPILVVTVDAGGAAEAVTPGVNGKIAFTSNRDGNDEIYVMNADGSKQTRLTHNRADDSAPAWSPDGTRIAFASARKGNREIYVMRADGSHVTRLTHHAGSDDLPAWSPDGTRIAFDSDQSGAFAYKIYVMGPDGSGTTGIGDYSRYGPAWSPNGARIAYVEDRYDAGLGDDHDEIYVMGADGSGGGASSPATPRTTSTRPGGRG